MEGYISIHFKSSPKKCCTESFFNGSHSSFQSGKWVKLESRLAQEMDEWMAAVLWLMAMLKVLVRVLYQPGKFQTIKAPI